MCQPILLRSAKVSQILINLSNNAVKFTEKGEVKISISVEERDGDDIKLNFAVSDSGIGMTQEQAVKLFNKFTQAIALPLGNMVVRVWA